MDVAIIGLPQSGKTTVFNALTRGRADTAGAADMHVGVVKVADPRLKVLAQMYGHKRIVQAEIKYWDLPGPESLAKSQGIGGKYLNVLQAADAFFAGGQDLHRSLRAPSFRCLGPGPGPR